MEDFSELKKFVIPPNTRFEERNIVVENDAIVGAGSKLGYGIIGKKIIVGERASIEGSIQGEEVRIDSWCSIGGDVYCNGDAYIGEFASIDGKLTVFGDLEIGRNVRIGKGFEARGLITIQNPLPVLIFIFLYILELLRLGRLEEAEKLFEIVEKIESPLIISENSKVNLEVLETGTDLIAESSRILGNIKAKNVKADRCEIFGSIRAKDIVLSSCRVHGAVEGKRIYLINETEVYGYVKGDKVYMEEKCRIDESITGRKGVWIKGKIELPEFDWLKSDEDAESPESVSRGADDA
ncbi:putative acyltransferase [Archaeoglobus sulfaticallidus PM70-1]|uniref:Putative acyltransferase n=2 Tax=Archaeoglobus TaxID=2233 RepID=N0BK37_9EURY|nr:putative acyltransferase [Archaeoglobus sulfaticallidus PM70-1]